MYERSSRVSGSMIWYSSSMPIVREGGFIAARRCPVEVPMFFPTD